MRHRRGYLCRSGALALIFPALASVAGAQVSIRATVNKDRVSPGEQITLTISVSGSGADLPRPSLPPLNDFQVYSAGNTQSLSIVNGAARSSTEYIYLLSPKSAGRKTIGPVVLRYRGQEYRTAPIPIEVSAGGAGAPAPGRREPAAPAARPPSAQGGEDVFLVATVDKPKPYVNEQVTLSVRFYTAVNLLGNPQYSPPELSGFISEDLPPERHGERVVNGRRYYFSEIRTALFPLRPGRSSIGSAKVRCQVGIQAARDPFSPDFFNKFFSKQAQAGGGVPKVLQSHPITVEARPLPAQGKPSNFSGAVGEFRVSASLGRSSARVGDAVTLSIAVEGAGNLKSIGTPTLPPLPSFRSYDTAAAFNPSKKGDVIGGTAIFRTVIVPRVSGNLEIPSISFAYFDPVGAFYKTLRTALLSLQVSPAISGKKPKGAPAPVKKWKEIGLGAAAFLALILALSLARRKGVPKASQTPSASPVPPSAVAQATRTVVDNGSDGGVSDGLINGKYKLLRLIGEGGMGKVYEARDHQLDRLVAVKVLREEIGLDPREKKRFLDEARISAALHHPFIVDIYEIAQELRDGRERICLVFEHVDGATLSQALAKTGRLRPEEVGPLLKDACEALAFAHQNRVIHRDLKPSNIMWTRQGHAKVMDFGIARQMKDAMTRTGTRMDSSGTMAYMAPEQHLGRYDARSDIFALGATVYELLAGETPFPGPDFILQKRELAFRPLLELAPGTPKELAEAVERCLKPDPQDRFQSAQEFARAIG